LPESCVIIGLGQIGMDYDYDVIDESVIYTHSHAVAAHPSFRLVGAVDISPAQRARFEQRFRAPAFAQVEVALRELQPNIVVIATSSDSHSSILSSVLNTCHPNLILCEKPLACNVDEARTMVEQCEREGVELIVNYIRRADPGVLEIKKRVEDGRIVEPFKINVWYSKGLLNNGSHFLNILQFWLGEVFGVSIIENGRQWNKDDPEPDFKVQFKGGVAIFRAAWEECYSHYGLEWLSGSGRLRYDRGGELIQWQDVHADPNFKGYRILSSDEVIIPNGMNRYQWNVYDNIAKRGIDSSSTLCDGRDALKTLEIINLIVSELKNALR